jgi:signal transduction histidine kinase
VKHVIETVHDGRITVQSQVGKGSVFRLFLPAVR